MTRTYVLDANAILNLAEDSPGSVKVEHLLEEAFRQRSPILVSVLNWGEVFYVLWQRRGEERARRTMASLSRLPLDLVSVDLPQALKASEIKALHKIPFVDCMAASLAEIRQAILVTSDRDFEKLGRRIEILWIGRPSDV